MATTWSFDTCPVAGAIDGGGAQLRVHALTVGSAGWIDDTG